MLRQKLIGALVLVGLMAFTAAPIRASDPCGVYALIEKVVLQPNDTEPTSIQVWGAFALSDGKFGGGYLAAQRGYLYYSCPKGRDTTCLNEWSDLKSVAGMQKLVGFGGRHLATGRLRSVAEPPGSPDVYPIQMGVMRIGPSDVLVDLKTALAKR